MDDERWERGMPVLDRQVPSVPNPGSAVASGRGVPAEGTESASADGPGPVSAAGPGQASVAGTGPASVAGPGQASVAGPGPISADRPARSTVPASLRDLPPRSVPETRPTPLQRHYVLLSVIPLMCGAIAISALELGASFGDPIVRACVLVGAPILFVVNADATLRIWRSAWAWMPVDAGKGTFRLAWVAVAVLLLAALVAASAIVLTA